MGNYKPILSSDKLWRSVMGGGVAAFIGYTLHLGGVPAVALAAYFRACGVIMAAALLAHGMGTWSANYNGKPTK